MNELPKARDDFAAAALEEHMRQTARQVGVQAVERELFPQEMHTDAVEVSLWVRGREVRATTDRETVRRIMDILTGLAP